MPQRPALFTSLPVLLGTARASRIDGVADLGALLQSRYRIIDLEPVRAPFQASTALKLEAATLTLGELAVTSAWGSALTLAVEPLQDSCMLALPAIGWGSYRLDADRIDNTFGETLAFLPGCGWRLINDSTGGTALHFSEQALLSRVRAMQGATPLSNIGARLSAPLSLKLAEPHSRVHHQQLLHALAMLDHGIRLGGSEPNPMLQLDDLILRCVALLLFPELSQRSRWERHGVSPRDLQQEIRQLMEWIRANLHRPLSLSEIEQQSVYGRRSIQAGFRQVVGCGPMQWMRQERLESARDQLLEARDGLRVSQVAQACGYLHLSSFSRDFRQRFGISPRQLLQDRGRTPQAGA